MLYLMIHAVDSTVYVNAPECGAPQDLQSWIDEMTARDVVLDGARLQPTSEAVSVRVRGADVLVLDGPFAETKEQIAGYDVIDVADLDEAIAVAAAHPTTRVGAIELRAFEPGLELPQVSETAAAGRSRYLMLVGAAMGEYAESTEPEQSEADAEVDGWVDSVADIRLYGWPLVHPALATTVRRVDGQVITTDGPFAETKEQIAGLDLLECTDRARALEAAWTHPVAEHGVLELRPLW